MAELKTKPTEASVEEFVKALPGEETIRDCFEIIGIMKAATKQEPRMWGPSIIGFGTIHLKYASGRELEWMIMGFSPRKQNLTLYLPVGSLEFYDKFLPKLGKYKRGKGCLYIKTMKDIDPQVLRELIDLALEYGQSHLPGSNT